MASTFPVIDGLRDVSQEEFTLKAKKATVAKHGMCVGNQMALAIKKKMALGHQNKKQFVPVGFRFQTKEERQKIYQPMGSPHLGNSAES
jgi:hypothetical protein